MGNTMTKKTMTLAALVAIALAALLVAVIALWPKGESQESAEAGDSAASSASNGTTEVSPKPSLQVGDTEEEFLKEFCVPTYNIIDRAKPETVILGFTQGAFCWDSTADPNLTAAILRTKELMTEDYYKSLDPNVRNSMNAEFLEAAQLKGISEPEAELAPTSANVNEEGLISRDVIVTWNWVSQDGSLQIYKGGRALVSVGAVEERPGYWSISGMQVNSVETYRAPADVVFPSASPSASN